jgi:hypothetical protein
MTVGLVCTAAVLIVNIYAKFSGSRLQEVGAPTADADAATKKNVDDTDAATRTYVNTKDAATNVRERQ